MTLRKRKLHCTSEDPSAQARVQYVWWVWHVGATIRNFNIFFLGGGVRARATWAGELRAVQVRLGRKRIFFFTYVEITYIGSQYVKWYACLEFAARRTPYAFKVLEYSLVRTKIFQHSTYAAASSGVREYGIAYRRQFSPDGMFPSLWKNFRAVCSVISGRAVVLYFRLTPLPRIMRDNVVGRGWQRIVYGGIGYVTVYCAAYVQHKSHRCTSRRI
jgi:hypothetical protein